MLAYKMKSSLLSLVLMGSVLVAASEAAELENHITHGPILGRVSSSNVGVWIRTAQPGTFLVRYGTDSSRLDQVTAEVETELESDCTGWVLLQNLSSRTQYYYRVEMPGIADLTGRNGSFRTLPDARQYHHEKLNPKGLFNFKFEYA